MKLKLLAALALAAAIYVTFFGKHLAQFAPNVKIMMSQHQQAGLAPLPTRMSVGQMTVGPVGPSVSAVAVTPEADGANDPTTTPPPRVNSIVPSSQELQREVAQNPHQAPTGLVRFAMELGQRLGRAEKSDAAATQFFAELEDCVNSPQNIASARALCLSNADRLSRKFAPLKDRAQNLRDKADPEVRRLSE